MTFLTIVLVVKNQAAQLDIQTWFGIKGINTCIFTQMFLSKNISKDHIEDFLELLKTCTRQNSIESYITIKNALSFFQIPTVRTLIKKGTFLYRGRPNKEIKQFLLETQIGARSDINKIRSFGRANEPLQSIFYCSDNCYTAWTETSELYRNNWNHDKEKVTIGEWEVLEDLLVAFLPSNELIKGLNPIMDKMDQNFHEVIELNRDESTDLLLKVLDFFSREFSKDSQNTPFNYLVSCAVANYYYENVVLDAKLNEKLFLNGFIFPSVMLPTEGMNIALSSEVYFSNKLRLNKATELTMVKVGDNIYEDQFVIESKKINQDNGKIIWS